MAIATTTQILHQGERNLVMQLNGIGDGVSPGNENKVVKVNLSTLVPRCADLKVMTIRGNVSYGIVELYWEALVPVKFAELSEFIDFDYRDHGGLYNNAGGGKTGNILLSTVGFEANSTYSIHLRMIKK